MKNLYFDYAAIVIQTLLLFTTVYRGLTKGRLNRCYLELITLSFVTVVFDILAAHTDNIYYDNLNFRYTVHWFYLLLHNMETPLYIIFLMILTDTDYKMKRVKSILYTLPFLPVLAVMIYTPFTHWVFYINDNLEYVRGPYFFVLYASAGIYMMLAFYFLIRYGRTIGMRRALGAGSVIPFLFGALIIQYFQPKALLEMFANSVALLFISTMIQRPEDILDTETGFSNKSACLDEVSRCISNKKPLNVIIVNISNYNSLQNMLGTEGVRALSKKISSEIASLSRREKCLSELFYLGNGIYCFEMNYTKLKMTESIAQKINALLSRPILFYGMEISLTAYVCIARCPQDIPDADALDHFAGDLPSISFTGELLYAEDLSKKKHFDLMKNLDAIIENALSNHLFRVYYQPIYSVDRKCFKSAEALIRLNDKVFGFVSPEIFIPAAEKSGAIHKIGAYVLEEVCSFIASDEFKKLGLDYIEVNLSVAQCMRSNLTDEIASIMNKYDVKPEQINLEITETAASYSQDTLLDNIEKLGDSGIAFSLDDYGTGYSNMERISTMLFELIKLDKSFVNAASDSRHDIVLAHTVSMIKEMGMKIVVEGVETRELLDRFSALGCDYIQGYYFSKPIPKDEFIKFISEHNATG